MDLLLEIISHQRHAMAEENTQFIFQAAGGTIGRNHDNDWLIDDSERLISGQHAAIHFDNNQFIIVDTSTNGLFVNNKQHALGDQKHIINNGDIFLLGQFSLQATLIATQSRAVFSSSTSKDKLQFSQQPSLMALHDSVSNVDKMPFISQDLLHEAPHNLNQLADPLSFFNDHSAPGRHSEQDILAQSDPINSVIASIPATQSYFNLPNAIPENWLNNKADNIEHHDQAADALDVPLLVTKNLKNEDKESIVGNFDDFKKDFNIIADTHDSNNNEEALNETLKQSVNDENYSTKEFKPQTKTPAPQLATVQQLPPATQVEQNVSSPAHEAAHNLANTNLSNSDFQDAINVLFDTLGINPDDVTPEQLPEITKNIALISKNSITGIMNNMISRAQLKNEFRLSMTTIQTQENNPLKFCINYQQLVQYMLVKPMSGYLDAEQAVKEAFDELQEHQIGVLAGMKSALNYMLEKLSPEKIVSKAGHSKLNTLLPGNKKSRYWEVYNDLYNDIKDEDDTFTSVFGNEFCKAYEQQIENIRRARN